MIMKDDWVTLLKHLMTMQIVVLQIIKKQHVYKAYCMHQALSESHLISKLNIGVYSAEIAGLPTLALYT